MALRTGSLVEAIAGTCHPTGEKSLSTIDEKKLTKLGIPALGGELASSRKYAFSTGDPLFKAFSTVRSRAKKSRAFIVLENLELLSGEETLLKELAGLVTILDDDAFSKFDVRFLLVGTATDVSTYFSEVKSLSTVVNRISELPVLRRFTQQQTTKLVETGFIELLEVNDFTNRLLDYWSQHIQHVTLGVPQRIQEYCRFLAIRLKDSNWQPSISLLKLADLDYIGSGFQHAKTAIQNHFYFGPKKLSRTNQVIFSISRIARSSFTTDLVNTIFRSEFPGSARTLKTLPTNKILFKLCKSELPLLRYNSVRNEFHFVDSRYQIALRILATKETEGKINLGAS